MNLSRYCGNNLLLANLRYDLCCETGFYTPHLGGSIRGIGHDPVDRFEPSVKLLLGEHDVARSGDYGDAVAPSHTSQAPDLATGASSTFASEAQTGAGLLDVFA